MPINVSGQRSSNGGSRFCVHLLSRHFPNHLPNVTMRTVRFSIAARAPRIRTSELSNRGRPLFRRPEEEPVTFGFRNHELVRDREFANETVPSQEASPIERSRTLLVLATFLTAPLV
jgi:hypothetical protein